MLIKLMRILILTMTVIIAAVAWRPEAQAGLGVVPSKIEFNVKPGCTAERTVNIYNTGDKVIRIECSLLDFDIDSNGEPAFLTSQEEDLACSKWLSVQPAGFEMQPKSMRDVKVRVSLPPRTLVNDKAAYLRIMGTGSISNVQTKPMAVLDALVLLNSQAGMSLAGGHKSDVRVSLDIPFDKRIWLSGSLPVSLNVENLSKNHADISGTLTIDRSGEQVGRSTFSEFVVFPASSRSRSQNIKFMDDSGLLDISIKELNGGYIEGPKKVKVMVLSRVVQLIILICLCTASVFLLLVVLRRRSLKLRR